MQLQNLNNLFSIFGSFLVFDDDVMPRINNIYSDCNISINQEPNNPQNKSGKVMRIVNQKEHYTIILRPNRIDVQFPGVQPEKMVDILRKMQEVFKEISDILNISEKTVRNHVSNVIQKLGVKSRVGAVIELVRLGEVNL